MQRGFERAGLGDCIATPPSASIALAINAAAAPMISPPPARTTRTRGSRIGTRSMPSASSAATSMRRSRAPVIFNTTPGVASAPAGSTPSPGATAASACIVVPCIDTASSAATASVSAGIRSPVPIRGGAGDSGSGV